MDDGYDTAEQQEILAYLTDLYRNVFTMEAIRAHLANHVGYPAAEYGVAVVKPLLAPGAQILDVGAGFGSFVLLARQQGFNAAGVEVASFEVEFARRRLARMRPEDDAKAVYLLGDAVELVHNSASLDAITFWNVLEHIDDVEKLVAFAARVLRPGGYSFIVCPNYAAHRDEAHYHVPWRPALRHDRAAAADYLEGLGRDPTFFLNSIFCRTNKEVLQLLRKHRFDLFDINGLKPMSLSWTNLFRLAHNWRQALDFYSPDRHSVMVIGRKRSLRRETA